MECHLIWGESQARCARGAYNGGVCRANIWGHLRLISSNGGRGARTLRSLPPGLWSCSFNRLAAFDLPTG